MLSQNCSADKTDLHQALAEIEQDICNLGRRIEYEQQAWAEHLTQSRSNGPHGIHRGTQIRTADDIGRQMQALDHHIEAYNIRVRVYRERGSDLAELALIDLVDADEGTPMSTEMTSTFMRRLIVSARMTLCIHGAGLRKVEDRMTFALKALEQMSSNVKNNFEEGRDMRAGCLWCLKSESESTILMLKATMARLGMNMARQRVIIEFFPRAEQTSGAGGDPHGEQSEQVDVVMNSAHDGRSYDGERSEGDSMGGDHGCETFVGDDVDACESSSDSGDVVEDMRGEEEKRQTRITNYFFAITTM